MISSSHLRVARVWLLLVLAAATALHAQRYTFRHYGPQDGLANLAVNCIFQDKTGYIWAGTDNGLFRYDGGAFQAFGHAQGLPNSEVRAISESPEGALWVVTQGGLARQEGDHFVPVSLGGKGLLREVEFDTQGRVYVRSIFGILRGTTDARGNYLFSPLVNGELGGMLVHDDGVWFTRDGDLWRLSAHGEERMGSPASLPSDRWRGIEIDAARNLWVRSSTHLYELPAGQSRFIDRSEGIPHGARALLYTDPYGKVFVSTDAGVVMLDGTTRTYIDVQHGLPIDNAGPALVDREGSLWIGLLGGGLVRRLGQGVWLSWTRADGLIGDSIWAIHHDMDGLLWVGTGSGLSVLDAQNKVVHSWSSANGLLSDEVRSVIQAPSGDVFAGLSPLGIGRFDRRGEWIENIGPNQGITDQIISMTIDPQGRLWAVGGESCFRSVEAANSSGVLKFERVSVPGTTKDTQFLDLMTDPGGAIWIATSQGLVRFDGSWRTFHESDGLRSAEPAAIAAHDGAIWISYRDALGITQLKFSGGKVQTSNITREDGLSSDLIYAITFDGQGRLWATTDTGVDVLDQGHWRHYGTEDGLIWDDADDLALSIDGGGNVWVGTSDGLSRYAAPADGMLDVPPPVVLTSIQGSARSFTPGERPTLSHAQNSLSFHYGALSYAREAGVRFRYRLLGATSVWTETRERSVRFDDLSAETYTFEVMAESANGTWVTTPAHFSFVVRPPWWQSWWFLSLVSLGAIFLGIAIWRFRMRHLIAQKEALELEIAERTEELRESHRQLEEFAFYDMLTSLPNRRLFTDRFRAEVAVAHRREMRFALALIDLDRFKLVNDTYGHDAGDVVLREAALRLQMAIRESDCVARLGGDEFAVLLLAPDGIDGVEAVCHRIVESFQEPIELGHSRLNVGCSLGVAMFPSDGDDQDSLYKSADLALYVAKRSGRNVFHRYQSGTTVDGMEEVESGMNVA